MLALESRIQGRIARRTEEDAKQAILLQAREALTQRRFAEAAAILDKFHGTARTAEVIELLEFAGQESERDQQQRVILGCYAEALNLQREPKYEAIVQLLEPVLNRVDDARLRRMLAYTERMIDQLRSEEEDGLKYIRELVDNECHEQAVAFIQTLPDRLAAKAEIKAIQTASQDIWKRQGTGLELLGQAYAALETSNLVKSMDKLTWSVEQNEDLKVLQNRSRAFQSRRALLVIAHCNARLKWPRRLMALDDKASLHSSFVTHAQALRFASDDVRAEWMILADQHKPEASSDKLLSRSTSKKRK